MTQTVSPEITETHARKIVELLGHGLVKGIGVQEPGKMCVEAAVCYALGLPHSDDPGCVSPALRRLKIGLNDSRWSSTMARAEGLKRLALVQLGSKGVLDDREFVRRVVDVTIRRAVPVGLRAAARVNPAHTVALEACAVRCEQEGTRESCEEARRVARAAYAADATPAYAYDAAYAADAAYDAAYAADAAYADAYAADAYAADAYAADAYAADAYAADAADAAADAADAAADAADAARTRDRVLAEYAEWIVEILIDMQAPGVQWLHLAPKAEGRA